MSRRVLSDRTSGDDASTAPLLVTPAAATAGGALLPAAGGDRGSIYPDSNMVIILAALLCVLICALALNSLLRCARYCGRSLAVGEPTAAADIVITTASAAAGLNRTELRKIPVVEYETKAGVPGTECAICLGEFADGEKVRVLPSCHHGFHVQCINTWLAAHPSCPICRHSLLEDHGSSEATVAREAT